MKGQSLNVGDRRRSERKVRSSAAENGPLCDIARNLTEKYFPCHMEIGKVIKHPDGYNVKVISGQYLDPIYGRLSNWWEWRRVGKNGKLGKVESGYGW